MGSREEKLLEFKPEHVVFLSCCKRLISTDSWLDLGLARWNARRHLPRKNPSPVVHKGPNSNTMGMLVREEC